MNFKDRRRIAENVALAFSLAIGSDFDDNHSSSNETKDQIE